MIINISRNVRNPRIYLSQEKQSRHDRHNTEMRKDFEANRVYTCIVRAEKNKDTNKTECMSTLVK